MKNTKVCVVGLGYIGLPTALMFVDRDVEVVGLEINDLLIRDIRAGRSKISEDSVQRLLKRAVAGERFRVSATPEAADVYILTVPTPIDSSGKPDLSFVFGAMTSLLPVLSKGNMVLLESTSPVGTTDDLLSLIESKRPDLKISGRDEPDINVCYCPERILPGNTVFELENNDRIIGGITKKCAERAENLYRLFVKGECFITDARTAELAKLAENAYRDLNIAFANELSMVCDNSGIDVWELIKLANRHPRVDILNPGPGVGGHCIAVDPLFIVDQDRDTAKLIAEARRTNERKTEWVVSKIMSEVSALGRSNESLLTVCFLGLSFKANVGDVRNSPALNIVKRCIDLDIEIVIVDPHVEKLPLEAENLKAEELGNAVKAADLVVMLVAHKEFFEKSATQLLKNHKNLIDTCGVL